MRTIQEKISRTAAAINRQIRDYADAEHRRALNVCISDEGKIVTIEDPMMLQQKVDDSKHIMNDMLRHLEVLLKERDGIA